MQSQKTDVGTYQTIITLLVLAVIGLTIALIGSNQHKTATESSGTKTTDTIQNTSSTQDTDPGSSTADSTANVTVPSEPAKVTCEDVTSYDYNWDNDVLCTNPDGSTFYTNYAGGRKYGYDF